VDPNDNGQTNRHRRKSKDELGKLALEMIDRVKKPVDHNNYIDLHEEYFDGDESELFVENISTKTLMLFKYLNWK